jgi:hypothetical protein
MFLPLPHSGEHASVDAFVSIRRQFCQLWFREFSCEKCTAGASQSTVHFQENISFHEK